ncbi:hypothetical protein N0V88_002595 [Collariella sp. IMI 366227]|nr:hypothetical protein N0V88_002595 [Collariella sp. IMI 366227]
MEAKPPVTIHSLPEELVLDIFSYFANPAPDNRLHDQPSSEILRNTEGACPLKTISLVQRRWRAIALPLLFRCAVWVLDQFDQTLIEAGDNANAIKKIPILEFLRSTGLGHDVRSFTMIINDTMPSCTDTKMTVPSQSSWRDPDTTDTVPHRRNSTLFHNKDKNWLWEMLFSLTDPLKFTIIASPQTLARLLSCAVFVEDAEFYSHVERLHILSLSRHFPSEVAKSPQRGQLYFNLARHCGEEYVQTALFTIRPWTHMLLNENSSIRVYRNYHFFEHEPPSILPSLLGCGARPYHVPLIPPSITSLSYVAIFPTERIIRKLECALPRLDHLFVQLIPRNDILLDPDETSHVDIRDLWITSTVCYNFFLGRLLRNEGLVDMAEPSDHNTSIDPQDQNANSTPGYNWRFLKEFESGDASSEDAWTDVMQYLNKSVSAWRIKKEGLLVRGAVPS